MSDQVSYTDIRFDRLYPEEARRLRELEDTVGELRAELDHYRQIFTAAVSGPVARQVLATLGIKLPPELR